MTRKHDRKVPYPSRTKARRAARFADWASRDSPGTVEPYLCECGSWHLTRTDEDALTTEEAAERLSAVGRASFTTEDLRLSMEAFAESLDT